ncbi:7tm Odorant receptor [Popillia japonica]|uniref:Odorant receptor n=1 Tax=Popillia japonica TaxID=7064 RepID=A0AAW1N579_POPJA
MPAPTAQAYHFMSFNVTILKLMGLWYENRKEDDKLRYLKILAVFISLSPTLIPLFCEFIAVLIGKFKTSLPTFRLRQKELADPTPDIVYRIQVVLAEVCVLGATYILICFVRNRSDIKDLVDSIGEFKTYSDLDLIAIDQKAMFFSKIVMGYSLSGMVIYTLSPLLSRSTCELTKSQYQINHGVPCGIIVPIRIPLDADNTLVITFWVIDEVINGVVIVLVIVNITMMVCGLLEHAINQLKQVRSCVLLISQAGDEEIEAATRFAVRYHTKVIEFMEKLEKLNRYFGSQLVLHFTLTSIVISLLGFEILMVSDNKESVMYALHLIGWLIMLYTICFYGQLLIGIGDSIGIAEDAYCTPWYNSPVNIQKDIKLIMLRAQKPLTLKALNLGMV